MVNVAHKRCTHRGFTKRPTYMVCAGISTLGFCSGHAKDGMENVVGNRCIYGGSTKRPSYGSMVRSVPARAVLFRAHKLKPR